jgi:hypothetical protein
MMFAPRVIPPKPPYADIMKFIIILPPFYKKELCKTKYENFKG